MRHWSSSRSSVSRASSLRLSASLLPAVLPTMADVNRISPLMAMKASMAVAISAGVSTRRPVGNSGWQRPAALVQPGAVTGVRCVSV